MALSSRVAATSPGISGLIPYFTFTTLPSASRQSNFGVVPVVSLGS